MTWKPSASLQMCGNRSRLLSWTPVRMLRGRGCLGKLGQADFSTASTGSQLPCLAGRPQPNLQARTQLVPPSDVTPQCFLKLADSMAEFRNTSKGDVERDLAVASSWLEQRVSNTRLPSRLVRLRSPHPLHLSWGLPLWQLQSSC